MGPHIHVLALAAAAIAVRLKPGVAEAPKPASFVGASSRTLRMVPAPIDPSRILAGSPRARVASHSTADDGFAETAVWDCTAGSFRWFFGWDETVVILEGAVHVTAEDGTARVLRPGDVGYFKAGTWATWRIDDYVRKVAFVRRPLLAPIALVHRIEAALRAGVRKVIRGRRPL